MALDSPYYRNMSIQLDACVYSKAQSCCFHADPSIFQFPDPMEQSSGRVDHTSGRNNAAGNVTRIMMGFEDKSIVFYEFYQGDSQFCFLGFGDFSLPYITACHCYQSIYDYAMLYDIVL